MRITLLPLPALFLAALVGTLQTGQAQQPPTSLVDVAWTTDGTWLLDGQGGITRLDNRSGAETTLAGMRASGPAGIAVDRAGNLIVADNGPSGARLSVYDTGGRLLRSVSSEDAGVARRLALGPRGRVYLLSQNLRAGLQLRRFDPEYRELAPVSVEGSCPANTIRWALADLAVDRNGDVWVADIMACGSTYTVRKYDPEGNLLDTLIGSNQFTREETDDSGYANVAALNEIFTAEDALFVVLGLSTPTGIAVDVWTLSGEYLRRAEVSGPPDSLVRGLVHDGQVTFVHLDDPDRTHTVALAEIEGRR